MRPFGGKWDVPLRTLRAGASLWRLPSHAVDAALRTLADAGLALDAAAEALDAGEVSTAEEHLDTAAAALETLRAAWPDLPPAGRAIVGPAGKEVRDRREALVKRLPKRRAQSEAAPEEADPEQDTPPDDA